MTMIKINIYTKDQNRMVKMPAYQLEIEGYELNRLCQALEKIAEAIKLERNKDERVK